MIDIDKDKKFSMDSKIFAISQGMMMKDGYTHALNINVEGLEVYTRILH